MRRDYELLLCENFIWSAAISSAVAIFFRCSSIRKVCINERNLPFLHSLRRSQLFVTHKGESQIVYNPNIRFQTDSHNFKCLYLRNIHYHPCSWKSMQTRTGENIFLNEEREFEMLSHIETNLCDWNSRANLILFQRVQNTRANFSRISKRKFLF